MRQKRPLASRSATVTSSTANSGATRGCTTTRQAPDHSGWRTRTAVAASSMRSGAAGTTSIRAASQTPATGPILHGAGPTGTPSGGNDMKRSVGLIIIVAAAVAVVAVATASRPARARIDSVVAVAPAHAARTVTADVPIKIRSAADAGALVSRAPFASDLGLSPDDVAATRAIYRFDSGTAGFAEGLSAYRTPLARGGFCISFAAGTSCTRTPPTPSEPV